MRKVCVAQRHQAQVAPGVVDTRNADLSDIKEKARPVSSNSSQVRFDCSAAFEAPDHHEQSAIWPWGQRVEVQTDSLSAGRKLSEKEFLTYVKQNGNSRMPVKTPSTIIMMNVAKGGSLR